MALSILDTAVIGGGISGLSCAYRLKQLADQHNTVLDVKIFEASERFGGIIRTMRHEDCLLEAGPDAFLSAKPAAISLIRELGLEKSVIPTNQQFRRSFVASGDRLKAVPEGFYMVAPSRIKPFLTSDILSPAGKIRALSEIFIGRSDNEDESVESFITRRFGR
ncbi:MAG: protoporphyrinogen oxidase [Planctomycetaceae bacterium]|nr:protoporphyrinogen oxidase [Planctomycetaceae bacterium]